MNWEDFITNRLISNQTLSIQASMVEFFEEKCWEVIFKYNPEEKSKVNTKDLQSVKECIDRLGIFIEERGHYSSEGGYFEKKVIQNGVQIGPTIRFDINVKFK